MNNIVFYLCAVSFLICAFSAVICIILLVISYRDCFTCAEQKIKGGTIVCLFCSGFAWLGAFLYIVDFDGFVWIKPLFFLSSMLWQVLLYHFIFIITTIDGGRKFFRLHYIIPFSIVLILILWSLLVPYEEQYFLATPAIFLIFNVVYSLLGLGRVLIYHKEVNKYAQDVYKTSVVWLYQLIFLMCLTFPTAFIALFTHRNIFVSSFFIVGTAFLPMLQYLVICYNLMSGNYVVIKSLTSEEERPEDRQTRRIDRYKFENYIKENKPYLNPNLKIVDMCRELGTNRTYLSAFINQEYGMNFSRFINLKRLEELDRIRIELSDQRLSGADMVFLAGFGSYNNYLRVKKAEDQAEIPGPLNDIRHIH